MKTKGVVFTPIIVMFVTVLVTILVTNNFESVSSNDKYFQNAFADHISEYKLKEVTKFSSSTKVKSFAEIPVEKVEEKIGMKIHGDISIQQSRQMRASLLDNIINEIEKLHEKDSKSEYKGKTKQIIDDLNSVKENIIKGSYLAAFDNLTKIKDEIKKDEKQKRIIISKHSKIVHDIDVFLQSIADDTKPIKGKIFLAKPKKQHDKGIPIDQILCKPSLKLMLKNTTDEPACVKQLTAKKLIDRGWGIPLE